MTVANLAEFKLDGLSPVELEERRRAILATIRTYPQSYDDPNLPTELLRELSVIVSTLRRRNAGPPKTAKPKGPAPKPTLDELDLLD